jgi:hypothetical protein
MASIDPLDHAAFELAIEIARRESAMMRHRIDSYFADGRSFESVGRSAAYHCQIESLGLLPYQSPPCYADLRYLNAPYGDPGAKRESAELAIRMRRCGVSRWAPNPVVACEAAETERARLLTVK